MTPEIKRYIDEASLRASRKAVRGTLTALGIDTTSPRAIQEFQRDMAYVRRVRRLTEYRSAKWWLLVATAAVTFVGAVAAIIVQQLIGK
jgi:hypothetical protein